MLPESWSNSQREQANRHCLICMELGYSESDILHCMRENGGPFNSTSELLDMLFVLEEEDFMNGIDREYNRLYRETLYLIQTSKCRVCKEKPRTVVLLPCSELMLCHDCAKNTNICPHCEEQVTSKIETFML